jgi:hypothetical protein
MGGKLGIMLTALVASAGLMVLSAPVAEAKTVTTSEWSKGFCKAVQSWQKTVTKAHTLVGAAVAKQASGSSAAKAAQKKIVSALDAARKGSTTASKAVKTLGAPDIDDGSAISATISTAIGNTAKVFSNAKSAVEKAPTEPKQFQAKVTSISAKVDRDYQTAGQDIDGIEALASGGELDKALNAEPACSFVSDS